MAGTLSRMKTPAALLLALVFLPAIAGEAEDFEAGMKAGEAALADGRYADAAAAFQKASGDSQAFGMGDARHVRALCKLSEALNMKGDLDGAEANAAKALALAEKHLGADHVETARALNQTGDALSGREKEAEAEAAYQRALAIRAKALGEDHPDTAETRGNLGLLAMYQKRYREAEAMFRQSMAAYEKAGDVYKASVMLNNLGYSHDDQGMKPQAEKEYRQALAMREKALRADHPEIGTVCSNLATVLQAQGQSDEAERLLKRALQLAEKALGPEDSSVAYALNNLGYVYQAQGRIADAEALYRRAQAIWEKCLPDSQVLANLLETYAVLLTDAGRQGEADALMARVERIRSKPAASPAEAFLADVRAADAAMNASRYADAAAAFERALAKAGAFGPRDERTVRALTGRALALRNVPDPARAEPAAREAVAAAEAALGPSALETAEALNTLALLLDDRGRPGEAEPLYQRVIAIRIKALGKDHLDVAVSLNNLGHLFLKQRKYPEAEKILRKALDTAERLRDEAYTAFVLNNLGMALENQKSPEAEAVYRRSLALYEKLPGPPPDMANTCFNLGNVLRDKGQPDEAVALLRKAAAVAEKGLGPQHPTLAKALHNLAVVLMGQGGPERMKEAEALYLRSRGIWETALGSDAPEVAQSLENHARLLEAVERKDEGAALRARAAAIHAKGR